MRERLTGLKKSRRVWSRVRRRGGADDRAGCRCDALVSIARPAPWHANTIVGLSATAAQTFNYSPESREMKPVGFTFRFTVENESGQDYTVPQHLKLLKRHKKSQALVEFSGKLDHSYVVLAKERAEIPVEVEYSCSTLDLDTNRESVRGVGTCFDYVSRWITARRSESSCRNRSSQRVRPRTNKTRRPAVRGICWRPTRVTCLIASRRARRRIGSLPNARPRISGLTSHGKYGRRLNQYARLPLNGRISVASRTSWRA